jgi:tellurite methyltransferase
MSTERQSWNQRYSRGSHGPSQPDGFFLQAYSQFVEPLFPAAGDAMDIAGGTGRHAIWLAQQGWRVSLVDISDIAIQQARQNAERAGVRLNCVVEDMNAAPLAPARYDLLVVFFYLERGIFRPLIETLRPGGLLIFKTYTSQAAERGVGPSHPMHLLQKDELLRAFSDRLHILHHSEPPGSVTAELVARKPSSTMAP